VLIQARYSTEEQRQMSIDDQINSCRRFLHENLPPGVGPDRLAIRVVREPEISGERLDRPGIDQIKREIDERRIDMIVSEESSRLYRHMTFAGMLFNAAVDAGIRILCPTDYIDTADDDWPERLQMSQSQHSRANHFTRARIKRAQLGLWERGAAVTAVKLGYRRRPSTPATAVLPAQGPFYDEVDEPQAVVIREVFDRIARGEPPWAVAAWLAPSVCSFPRLASSPRSGTHRRFTERMVHYREGRHRRRLAAHFASGAAGESGVRANRDRAGSGSGRRARWRVFGRRSARMSQPRHHDTREVSRM
jgi:hypothetical protein